MSKVITFQTCGVVLDALYHNALRDKTSQKSIQALAKDCGVSIATIYAFRDILINLKILIKEGVSRSQRIYWHPDKCAINDNMARNVYNIYTGGKKKRTIRKAKKAIKVEQPKLSLDTVLSFLVNNGYTGTIIKQENKYTTTTIDLSNYDRRN